MLWHIIQAEINNKKIISFLIAINFGEMPTNVEYICLLHDVNKKILSKTKTLHGKCKCKLGMIMSVLGSYGVEWYD